ncbi:hypothetical protein N7488_006104 [Penicillium malachiteum]|nr:hypothetical protein N7488_006104 [Penicillium malachiteum]
MAEIAQLYNTLPTLGEADEKFDNRGSAMKLIAMLLAQYNNVFGLCLVHANYELSEGEVMVARGNVSQPEEINQGDVYPERWLSDGGPYEFTARHTSMPPSSLVKEFQRITSAVNLQDVLGLYQIDRDKNSPALIE